MDDEELFYSVALSMVPEVGPVLAKNLLSYAGGAREVFRLARTRLERVPGIGPYTAERVASFADFKRVERQLEYLGKTDARVIRYHEPDYPQRLKRNNDAPLLLYFRGNAPLNPPRVVGVVGTRQCSEEGRGFTEKLVHDMKSLGCCVVSGLAYGIDIHAHRAAVHAGLCTVGVVAHGLDTLYPSRHIKTVQEMYNNGGMLTEYPIETRPDRENFPSRNRIVAGMVDALIVIETAFKGGAMITAHLANGYNRDVFAIPGKVGDPRKEGNHFLIKKNKAALMESVEDLIGYMGWEPGQKSQQTQLPLELTSGESAVYRLFCEKEKWSIDDLNTDGRVSSSDITLQLLELEMKGLIRCLPGKIYQKVS